MSRITPILYSVVIKDDKITTEQQAIQTLEFVFNLTNKEATAIAKTISKKGSAVVGDYILEIAETKVKEVEHICKINEDRGLNLPCFIVMKESDARSLAMGIMDQLADDDTDDLADEDDTK